MWTRNLFEPWANARDALRLVLELSTGGDGTISKCLIKICSRHDPTAGVVNDSTDSGPVMTNELHLVKRSPTQLVQAMTSSPMRFSSATAREIRPSPHALSLKGNPLLVAPQFPYVQVRRLRCGPGWSRRR